MFPTADQIAVAIVTACRLTGESPIECGLAVKGIRGRAIALDALLTVFPDARKEGLCRKVGYRSVSGLTNLSTFRRSLWWRDEWVDEVVGVLVGDQYGEQGR